MKDKQLMMYVTKDPDLSRDRIPLVNSVEDCREIACEIFKEKGISNYEIVDEKFIEHPPNTIFSIYNVRIKYK